MVELVRRIRQGSAEIRRIVGIVTSVVRRWKGMSVLTDSEHLPSFNEGVYTVAEAARILGRGAEPASSRQVRYWLASGLTTPTHRVADSVALSFEDLISLEIVRRLRAKGVSLHSIRRLEEALRELNTDRERPLAYEAFFTDGASIWAQGSDADANDVIEVVGRYHKQYAWTHGISTFADEIRFEPASGRAITWSPTPYVDLDPRIQFGAPVVSGTRIPVRTIETNLTVGTPADVAAWYGLTEEQVLGVRDYLAAA